MNTRYQLLSEIMLHLEDFQVNASDPDNLRDFVVYLKERAFEKESREDWLQHMNFDDPSKVNTTDVAEVEFSTLVATLFRFAKGYTKKAFEKTTFKTLDEFGFMASIFKHGSLHKSEVIEMHMLEISSGSEILKRLLKLGLIQETQDSNDRRAKRISLTPKGYQEIILAFQEMGKVSKVIAGNLNSQELNETIYTLNKLKHFHDNIHEHDKGQEIDSILEKYF